jgi:uncharacterized protein
MAKPTPFTVLVRDLPVHRRFEVASATVADWLRGLPMRDALGAADGDDAGKGVAELDLYADGNNVLAAGTFKGHLTVACSRCVGPVRIDIDDKVRVTFMPASEMPQDEDESEEGLEVAEDDLDLFPYDGERVDLEPLLREEFVLAVPFAPLCAETCKGLCSQCGIDLNAGTCSCEAPIDPRLAALKGLKLPL